MGFSDMIFESYLKIYEGIQQYNDYCDIQKQETLNAMVSLQKILYSFNQLNAGEELTDAVIEGIKINCEHYYQKALCGMDFDDDVHSDDYD